MPISFSPKLQHLIKTLGDDEPSVIGNPGPIPGVQSIAKPSITYPSAQPGVPWEAPVDTGESAQKALEDFWHERRPARLFLVSRQTQRQYEVLEYDGETGRAKLRDSIGMTFNPRFAQCEGSAPLVFGGYFPLWIAR